MKPFRSEITRRKFFQQAGSSALALTLGGASTFFLSQPAAKKINAGSRINGVEIGIILPYALRGIPGDPDAEQLLSYVKELGISYVEMQAPPAERFAGISADNPVEWRLSAGMEKFKELRKLYNDAGVEFYAFKQTLSAEMSDEEYDYTFRVARTLGASQVTMELPRRDPDGTLTNRIGQFAEKHQLMVAYHNHTQANINFWDRAVWQSEYNGLNLDIGHYVAANGPESLMEILDKHWTRIGSLHLKDRKVGMGDNVPWGEGDTPIAEVLQLMRDRKAPFQATIELEYNVPVHSDPLQEVSRCLEYCRRALEG